ncbi:aldo/keto reductase [Bradyrhizobium sp. 2TAF24]|uniref:aldo/keto reductase n=1 Tax=Bradyrhizobium sp. 2TAF24 TaxID=3233011 RepID=UPI003F92213B
MPGFTRRDFLAATAALPIAASARAEDSVLITRPLPGGGASLPAVGLGTAVLFNSNDEATRQKADAVTHALIAAGGRLIDTASTYGLAETVFGEVIAAGKLRDKLFIASKVEAPDTDELTRSLSRLKISQLDLLQLHNVHDPQQSLARFREWKAQGLCRHIGITSTFRGDLPAIEAVLRREKPEFVQVDYSIDNREAESRVLPIAAEVGAGVLTALPFGRGRLFRAVHGKELPDWAKPFAASWAQFFLKYLLGDPRVTAVIPGTGDAAHMTDNAGAMRGPLPDVAQRKQMAAFVDGL